MSVQLQAIRFNHNSASATNDALTIRKNRTQAVNIPEWVNGISLLAQDSMAAYSAQDTKGNLLTIKARLLSSKFSRAEVRAIDPFIRPREPRGCLAWIIWFISLLLRAITGNVLGEVKAKWVSFTNGDTGFVDFELKNHKIGVLGVGIYFTEWQWQYRLSRKQPWQNIEISKHKIYVVLETPKAPWNQVVGSDQLPWTEALDYACEWARLAKTRDEAASKITTRIYALGPSIVEYDCPGGGSSHYTVFGGSFNCTKFLERLKGMTANGKYVNCTDCGTFVSCLSNLVGCDLWSSRMTSNQGFDLNPLLGIGSSVWQTACGWGGFSYHEVAWKNNCDVNDEVFDACLQVDGDANPTAAPHSPLLPVNMIFGDCNSLNYRLRLTPPNQAGCGSCIPLPSSRVRRSIY